MKPHHLVNYYFQRHVLSIFHIKDSLTEIFKKRFGYTRMILLLLSFIFLLFHGTYTSEKVINYLYTRNRYGWEIAKFSYYETVTAVVSLVGK